jgi:hypothetical protein
VDQRPDVILRALVLFERHLQVLVGLRLALAEGFDLGGERGT